MLILNISQRSRHLILYTSRCMLGYSQKTDGGCHLCILPVVLQSTISPRGGAFTYIWHPGLCSRYPGDTSRSSGSGDQGSCTSGYHVTIRETADCPPLRTLTVQQQTETHPQSGCEKGLFAHPALASGAGFW